SASAPVRPDRPAKAVVIVAGILCASCSYRLACTSFLMDEIARRTVAAGIGAAESTAGFRTRGARREIRIAAGCRSSAAKDDGAAVTAEPAAPATPSKSVRRLAITVRLIICGVRR